MGKIIQIIKKILRFFPDPTLRMATKAYKRMKYFGFRNKCVMCGARINTFLPAGFSSDILKKYKIIGGGYRQNVRCPHCNSSNRERLIYLYLKQNKILKKSSLKILHFAPERRLQKVLMKMKNAEYISADINSSSAARIIDVRSIPYRDNYFDNIICSHVLEHVPEDTKAMSEIYRTLKKGGLAIIQVPISPILDKTYEDSSIITPEDRYRAFGQTDHVRIYGQDFFARLKSVGFNLEVYNLKEHLTHKLIQRYGLDSEEKLFLSHKKNE